MKARALPALLAALSAIPSTRSTHALPLAYTATILHPAGFSDSYAVGVSGTTQAGWGYADSLGNYHALLWHGTAASAIDLNPSGFIFSEARDASDASQVGAGSGPATGGNDHALLWSGTAASYIDLNPAGFNHSNAYGISDTTQV